MVAQDLFHELNHALILIGMDIERESTKAGTTPAQGQTSKVYQKYKTTFDVVSGQTFEDQRNKVTDALKLLFIRSFQVLGRTAPTNLADIAAGYIEKFVNEKFVFGKTGERFGYTPKNITIATNYVPNYVMEVLTAAFGSPPPAGTMATLEGDRLWRTLKNNTITAVTSLYTEMDKDLTLKGYMLPGLTTSMPIPATPLQMSGTPVKLPGTTEEKMDISKLFPE